MKAFLCELFLSCLLAAPADGARPIDELVYGTVLYAYYQEDYQQGLLEVMVAERQQRLGADPVRFELARGSFAFQERMYRLAGATFDRLEDGELTDLDRRRLAFHSARERYRQADWDGLDRQLALLDATPAGSTGGWRRRATAHPEVGFMRAEAALARNDFHGADSALQQLDPAHPLLGYGLFNLGVGLHAAGAAAPAEAAFERLSGLEPRDAESRDLIQRGRLALAALAREQQRPTDAEAVLRALPAESRYRDPALGSYAGLAMDLEDHALASRIWLTLQQREDWSSSRAAAYLGLPASLERMGTPGQALLRYREAEQVFESRLALLQQFDGTAADPHWVRGLLEAFAVDDTTQRDARLAELDPGLGIATWIRLLAGEELHRTLLEWRELHGMAQWLEALPPRIEAFESVTGERRRRGAAAREMLEQQDLQARREALSALVAATGATLQQLRGETPQPTDAWMSRLATPAEQALLQRLSRMAALAGAHMSEHDRARWEPRIERLRGLVFWTIANEYRERLRELEKQLAAARGLLADTDQRLERLALAEARFVAGVETDFLALRERSAAVVRQVEDALQTRERHIAVALQRDLEQQQAQLRQYLLAARVAIARTSDRIASAAPAAGADG